MADQEEMRAAEFESLHSCNAEESPGYITVRFIGADDNLYRIQISRKIVGLTVVAIAGQAGKTSSSAMYPETRETDVQHLRWTGLRPMIDPQGRPAVMLVLEGGLELGLAVAPDALAALKNDIGRLEEIVQPPDPDSPRQ